MTPEILLAAEKQSAEVTDWAARIGWLVGLALFIALVYWLMREGWKWRGTLQGDLPELPSAIQVLQTAAGRMVFARVEDENGKRKGK